MVDPTLKPNERVKNQTDIGRGSAILGAMTDAAATDPLFSPAERKGAVKGITRPSLSYWQDAWIRLKQNKQALVSLGIIIGLLAFTGLGPMFWTLDPAEQNLNRISEPPSGFKSRVAVVVPELTDWEGLTLPDNDPQMAGAETVLAAADLKAPQNFKLAQMASTVAVRLQWDYVLGATGYAVYRSEVKPNTAEDLGLPVGQTEAGNKLSYDDQFDLKAGSFFYTVVPQLNGESGPQFASLKVEIPFSVTESKAQELKEGAKVGDQIPLVLHPFGLDYLGRDLLARLMAGARVSLFIGIAAPLLAIVLGVIIGGISGFFGGRIDNVLMRFTDFVLALPFLLFMILFKVTFGGEAGESGIMPMLVAMVVLSWTGPARLVRGQVLQLRESEFVQASRLLGARSAYLIFRHLLPNTLGVVMVSLTFAIPTAIFTEAFLSFIGMGVVPPTPSWGSMCNDGIQTFLNHPHEFLFPALFISLAVLAFNLFGDGLRDALDPRMRGRS